MNQEQQLVRQFSKRFDHTVNEKPTIVDADTAKLWYDIVNEEIKELLGAIYDRNLVKIADALADLQYTVYGTSLAYGIDLEPIFFEVHRSNMTKGDPEVVRASNGKILKSRNWSPPNLAPLIERQIRGERCIVCNRFIDEIPPEEGIDMNDHIAFENRDSR